MPTYRLSLPVMLFIECSALDAEAACRAVDAAFAQPDPLNRCNVRMPRQTALTPDLAIGRVIGTSAEGFAAIIDQDAEP